MKKLLIFTLSIFTLTMFSQNQTNLKTIVDSASKNIVKAGSTVYGDSKEVIATLYGDSKHLLETGVTRLDTILNHGYKQLTKGAAHTFEVLKTQQLVKSCHHLFLWILGIIIIFSFISMLKNYSEEHTNPIHISIVGILALALGAYNSVNFMEMWTGFMNPEYGVYLEILEYIK